jgi:hypothetical protein
MKTVVTPTVRFGRERETASRFSSVAMARS